MSNIAVKTKGDSSPQGKSRVYFSCHPDDFDKCFEIISKDIFDSQNCAVYYESDRDTEANLEDLEARFSDMQLFVIPLTTNFLTKPSRAKDFEYGFAMDNHIPVLPIAMESGIDKLFSEIMNKLGEGYGDVQFLDKTLNDPTAIPYEEKLKGRLEAIIVGNELAERVRAAFDAYIFLSYRKKDRQYAKELMTLIHRIPYCRDIAIWYDEFLTPGEAWNTAIAEAMAKSALVVLTVTPNITEPNNFIIEHEYPNAKINGKEVLPAELLPTNSNTLKILFPGISEIIDAKDAEALSTALKEELKGIALQENDNDPEHNYLIGLAYLGGIDVERDTEKAVSLIKESAEKGVLEAIDKIASMYHNGDGIKRDYQEEKAWLKKKVEVCKNAYESDASKDNGIALFNAHWYLNDSLRELYEFDQAKVIGEEWLRCAKEINNRHSDYDTLRFLGICYNEIGTNAREQRKYNEAKEWYREYLTIIEKMLKENDTDQARQELSAGYINIGHIATFQKSYDEAKEWYQKSINIRKKLLSENDSVDLRQDVSACYISLGQIATYQGEFKEAYAFLQKALDIMIKLVEETDSIFLRRDLSIIYNCFGKLARAQKKLNEAKEWYQKSLDVREKIVDETDTIESREELCFVYRALGKIAKKAENCVEAKTYFQKHVLLSERLFNETGNIKSLNELSVLYEEIGVIANSQGDLLEAYSLFQKDAEVREKLVEICDTLESIDSLCVCYNNLGLVAYALEKYDEAKVHFYNNVKLTEKLVAENKSEQYHKYLNFGYEKLGEIAKIQGNNEEAKKWYRKYYGIID